MKKETEKKRKRILTHSEEFEIMKLVLDKFLWIGVILLIIGLYLSITSSFSSGFWFIISGAAVMVVFAWLILKEFEKMR
jgi:hypothetical protein